MVVSKFMNGSAKAETSDAKEELLRAELSQLPRMPAIIAGEETVQARLLKGPVPTWMHPPKKKRKEMTELDIEREKHGGADVETDCHGGIIRDCRGNAVTKKK